MPSILSLRAYAKHRGCSLKAVQKAIQTGRIQTTPEGKIDPEAADQLWQLATDHSKRRDPIDQPPAPSSAGGSAGGAAGDDPADDPQESEEDASSSGAPGARGQATANAYSKARAARETYVAQIKRLEFEELSGSLVRVDEIQRQITEAVRATRDAILNLPNRISAELASETDPHQVHVRLSAELTQALEELASAFGKRG